MRGWLTLAVVVQLGCQSDALVRVCRPRCYTGPEGTRDVGACRSGDTICLDHNEVGCENEVHPAYEVCDDVDNDCNGLVDDGLTQECSSACGTGVESCQRGRWVGCTAPPPAPEVCDYQDNDCDGDVDDRVFSDRPLAERVCYSGPIGTEERPPCDTGLLGCVNGEVVCLGEVTPWAEVCDGIDNDCDGEVDEGTDAEPPPPSPAFELTPEDDPTLLAEEMVGQGISIVPGSAVYLGAPLAAGLFVGGEAAGLQVERGLILTTGSVMNALGPNNQDNAGTYNGLPGDPDLDLLVESNTHDATVLEFDFYTEGGDLYFSYVFASDEYNEYANRQFNDVFAFFIDGVNIALIPTTTTHVAINTINGGNPLGTNARRPELFRNNDISDGGPFYGVEYDGMTVVLVAADFAVGAGVHHIKLVVADRGDQVYDSAVFIQGRSFSGCP